jgi:hypothetical protein
MKKINELPELPYFFYDIKGKPVQIPAEQIDDLIEDLINLGEIIVVRIKNFKKIDGNE